MNFKIATIPGDGIGPDVIVQAIKVLNSIGKKYGHEFSITETFMGGIAIDKFNTPLPDDTIEKCKQSDAVLLGAVGGPKWDTLSGEMRPEAGLLGIRKSLGLYANLRPVNIFAALKDASPLKSSIIGDGLDILIVRELTGGIYFGKKGRIPEEDAAYDTEYYTTKEVERVLRVGFEAAMKRSGKLTVVDKANVMESSRFWREIAIRMEKEYPQVETSYMYVDNATMQLIRNPRQFDVIVTSNLFGDILSDEASMITGSIGMLPSASLADGSFGLYEPIHGSAPDIAGKDLANPLATILSVAMMFRYSFNLNTEAECIEKAVTAVLEKGYRTGDIKSEGCILVGTQKMGDLVVAEIEA
jgi:3-isopropylmalate dehydrogenase